MQTYNCEHLHRTRHNTENTQDQYSEPGASDSESECSDTTYHHCPSSIPIYSAPMSSFSIPDMPPSTITPTGVQNIISLPEGTPTYSAPLTAANLASFDALPTGQGYAPLNNIPNQRGPGGHVWYCSNCGDGPHNYKLVVICTNCEHKRDKCCVVKKG